MELSVCVEPRHNTAVLNLVKSLGRINGLKQDRGFQGFMAQSQPPAVISMLAAHIACQSG